jgi:hypothetical protein
VCVNGQPPPFKFTILSRHLGTLVFHASPSPPARPPPDGGTGKDSGNIWLRWPRTEKTILSLPTSRSFSDYHVHSLWKVCFCGLPQKSRLACLFCSPTQPQEYLTLYYCGSHPREEFSLCLRISPERSRIFTLSSECSLCPGSALMMIGLSSGFYSQNWISGFFSQNGKCRQK